MPLAFADNVSEKKREEEEEENKNKLWCESTTNPVPVLRIRASRGFSELTQKCNQVVPWSLHTFPVNLMQIGPAVFS